MGEEITSENGRISDFQGLVTLTLTLDRIILHTDMHQSLIDPLPTRCHWNRRNFLWTDGRTDGRTGERTFETHFIRSSVLWGVYLKLLNFKKRYFFYNHSSCGNKIWQHDV